MPFKIEFPIIDDFLIFLKGEEATQADAASLEHKTIKPLPHPRPGYRHLHKAAEVSAAKDESESPKSKTPRKGKKKIPALPTRPANLLLWVNTWEVIDPQIETDKTLRIDIQSLIRFLYLQNRDDIINKEDTLRKIITCGKAKKLNRAELERKNKI